MKRTITATVAMNNAKEIVEKMNKVVKSAESWYAQTLADEMICYYYKYDGFKGQLDMLCGIGYDIVRSVPTWNEYDKYDPQYWGVDDEFNNTYNERDAVLDDIANAYHKCMKEVWRACEKAMHEKAMHEKAMHEEKHPDYSNVHIPDSDEESEGYEWDDLV